MAAVLTNTKRIIVIIIRHSWWHLAQFRWRRVLDGGNSLGTSREPVGEAHVNTITMTCWSRARIALMTYPRNDIVDDFVTIRRALNAIFATLKAIVDDESSTISSTISLGVAWPYVVFVYIRFFDLNGGISKQCAYGRDVK